MPPESFHIFAPAKVNLFLHITGKRDDGYHTLQSLIVFADVGDSLQCSDQNNFDLSVTGPFAPGLPAAQDNLVYKAAIFLSEEYKTPLRGKIVLTKNLPVASGIGGGSADAAAALKGFVKLWGLPEDMERLQKVATRLGADVPACLHGKTVWAEGVGEQLRSVPHMPVIHAVLVNPLTPVPTAEVFKKFQGHGLFALPLFFPGEKGMPIPDIIKCRNDLTRVAIDTAPVIRDVLVAIERTEGCFVSRLSGSGATCFGLYESDEAARHAAETIKRQHSDWWVMPTRCG